MLEKYTESVFSECKGSTFRIHLESKGAVEVVLVDVQGLGVQSSGEDPRGHEPTGRAPFSVVFRGPMDVQLTQGTYTVVHDTLGALDLFLVPIGPDQAGMRFEAVFN